jgi:hypothetical protein
LSNSITEVAARWPNSVWLIPRLVAGFTFVFLYEPIFHSILLGTRVPAPLFPLNIYVHFFDSLSHDVNYLYALVILSLIAGFFAADVVLFWNKMIFALPRQLGMDSLFFRFIQHINGKMATRPSATQLPGRNYGAADFQIWLLSEKEGMPGKYLESQSFYFDLFRYYKHVLLLFCQLWTAWGIWEYYRLFQNGNGFTLYTLSGLQGLGQFAVILLFGIVLYLITRAQANGFADATHNARNELYDEYLKKHPNT